jgi:hypothetical protein
VNHKLTPRKPVSGGKRTFTPEEVRMIRASGTAQSWAYHFQCGESTIYKIRQGIHYKDVGCE